MMFFFLLITLVSPFAIASEDAWPKEVLPFFEQLTSPMKDWSPSDFGAVPTDHEKELLEKYKPRVFIGPKGLPPIDFYNYYLPKTTLKGPKRFRKKAPTRADLKEKERTPGFFLDFKGKPSPCRGESCEVVPTTLYGRAFYEPMGPWFDSEAHGNREVIVLKYNAVFALSGLPKKLKWWKSFGPSLVSRSLEDWHELDIHGAVHIILDAASEEPLVLLLAQHNHFQSFIVGTDIQLPTDQRFPICFSVRSNEPYVCSQSTEPQYFRTVGDPRHYRFVVMGGKEPMRGGYDVVYGPNAGGVELSYEMTYLPHKDPLYVSWIPLGDKRKILGLFPSFSRSGPPGININTWPELKRYSDIAQFWYFERGDSKGVEILEQSFTTFFDLKPSALLRYHSSRFWPELTNANMEK